MGDTAWSRRTGQDTGPLNLLVRASPLSLWIPRQGLRQVEGLCVLPLPMCALLLLPSFREAQGATGHRSPFVEISSLFTPSPTIIWEMESEWRREVTEDELTSLLQDPGGATGLPVAWF